MTALAQRDPARIPEACAYWLVCRALLVLGVLAGLFGGSVLAAIVEGL